jgi:hypothetical protein
MPRRWGIAVAVSLAAHLFAVGGIFAVLMLRGMSLRMPIDVEIMGMRLDEVHDLPLGPPPGGADSDPAQPRPKARRRPPRPPAEKDDADGELAGHDVTAKPGVETDPDATPEGATPRASSLRQYGPEGSRVTVLLRLDRLRDTPYAPALDALLERLPDRRDLLAGTGLDLYKTFDALLIATPNPLDYTVTFLAARHRLKDAELRTALERGAKATGRVLTWRTEGHRPFAERHARTPVPGASRDERLIVLPAPGLVVVTPPIYRSLLFSTAKPVGTTGDKVGPDGGVVATPAGASASRGTDTGTDPQWGALLRRIDAQDGIMPADAVAMLSAIDIFSAPSLQRGLNVVPRGRALSQKLGEHPTSPGTVMGMEVPRTMTASIAVKPSPTVDVVAEFESLEQAVHWEQAWPALHQRFRTNPYVMLTGFGPLVARAELTRTELTIHLKLTATDEETLRLLQIVARLTGGQLAAPP